jgi:hypothetical protein
MVTRYGDAMQCATRPPIKAAIPYTRVDPLSNCPQLMPPRRALLDDDEDLPMPAAHDNLYDAAASAGPIALDFGAPPETLFQQLVRHWLNERHAPDLLPVQAEVLSALLDHSRRQVRFFFSPRRCAIFFLNKFIVFLAEGYRSSAARRP